MRSLSLKLVLGFLTVSLVGTALVAFLAARGMRGEFDTFLHAQLEQRLVDELCDHYLANGGWSGIEQVGILPPSKAEGLPGAPGVEQRRLPPMMLVDGDGRVVLGDFDHRVGETVPPERLADGVAIEVDGRTVGWLVIASPPWPSIGAVEQRYVTRVLNWLLWASGGAACVALLLSVPLSRALTRPLREVTAAARVVAGGALGHQVPVRSRDELGELAQAFNRMSADLALAQSLRRQMTADVAHELRTPLSLILGHTEALCDGVLPPTPETLAIVHDEARRLARLVDDLRTLSLSDAGELSLQRQLTDPYALLSRAAAAFRTQALAQSVQLLVEADPALPEIDADPDRLAQVLHNLVSNALRHTPEGQFVVLAAAASDGHLRIVVEDTGPGIAPEDLPHVFERFYRTDRSRHRDDGGTGLGLAIARSIIEAHGGRIWVDSEPGDGATFTVELPMAAKELL